MDIKVSEDGTDVTKSVSVPVLDASLPEYKDYLPAGSEPTGSATPSPSPSATGTGAAH